MAVETQMKQPIVNVDILVVKGHKILLGLLTEEWCPPGIQNYGVPGREILFGETIGSAVNRHIVDDLGCVLINHKVICVNANYALENHYIGVGVVAEISGDVQLLHPEDWLKWEWFDRNQVPSNLFDPAKNLIECYLSAQICVSE